VVATGGCTAQAARTVSSAVATAARHRVMMPAIGDEAQGTEYRLGMWMILLEAGIALGLLLFIVWWTWPRSENKDDSESK
jgi:hypothetical protein